MGRRIREGDIRSPKSTLPGGEDATLTKQKTWNVPLIAIDKTLVWSSNNNPLDQARLLAVSAPHAGDWLLKAPIASCGLGLSNEAVLVAIGLRLGLNLCAPHQCQCGETTDPRGHHGLVCKQSRARASRHFAMNDIIWRSLLRADIPSSKEPLALCAYLLMGRDQMVRRSFHGLKENTQLGTSPASIHVPHHT